MDRDYSNLFALRGLVLYLIPFFILGWLIGYLWETLTLGLAGLVVWHYYYQQRLTKWLWQSRNLLPPTAPGSWSYIYDGIYRNQRRSQHRRRSLARLLRRFREAAEALPDAAIVFRKDGSLLWSNKLAQFYFGLRWPDDAGMRLSNLIRHPEFFSYLNKGDFSEALTIPSPMRDSLDIEIRVMPYSDDQFLLVARDVTQLKQLENMRRDFVANVSHELKTPLTVLQGYLEMLGDVENTPPAMTQKALTQMQQQSDRMKNLVDQLLQLSRMETPSHDVFEHVVDVPTVLGELRQEAEKLSADKQLKLVFDVEPIRVYGKSDLLRSAMQNLVTNAVRYTQAGGNIRVTWRKVRDEVEFSVEDNGPGIENEHIPRLTERFYRVDADRNSDSGGTGLGLSIVKQALEHHNSHLEVNSKPGAGSRFWFRLPAGLIEERLGKAKSQKR
ncbi:two-component system sensor histidine kinase PhoR [Idiomarina sp. OT37-5b]|uniref:Phosphate regulon sensor protein PhoR n=1 Tax=Idiomarina aquatica TaxID=1327752 RepID=A0AA94EE49_9GAMM|nr:MULTISPECIES: phosphate regulon sensor histidine kinase PhoR [Idiomarina]AVJ56760.1 two-component system sensor histidine kinase PhoR [Idiomarina sp. OT37-5b]RUO42523.1 two-component system sensor histidine kinase PhoR [Idiomarina aquatica]